MSLRGAACKREEDEGWAIDEGREEEGEEGKRKLRRDAQHREGGGD